MAGIMTLTQFLFSIREFLLSKITPYEAPMPDTDQQWLRLGAVDIDFDVYDSLPYTDIKPLAWSKDVGFVELEQLGESGRLVERWIPLHESKPQVHVIRQLKDGRMYRLGLSMPSEAEDNMPHGRYGAFWIEPK